MCLVAELISIDTVRRNCEQACIYYWLTPLKLVSCDEISCWADRLIEGGALAWNIMKLSLCSLKGDSEIMFHLNVLSNGYNGLDVRVGLLRTFEIHCRANSHIELTLLSDIRMIAEISEKDHLLISILQCEVSMKRNGVYNPFDGSEGLFIAEKIKSCLG